MANIQFPAKSAALTDSATALRLEQFEAGTDAFVGHLQQAVDIQSRQARRDVQRPSAQPGESRSRPIERHSEPSADEAPETAPAAPPPPIAVASTNANGRSEQSAKDQPAAAPLSESTEAKSSERQASPVSASPSTLAAEASTAAGAGASPVVVGEKATLAVEVGHQTKVTVGAETALPDAADPFAESAKTAGTVAAIQPGAQLAASPDPGGLAAIAAQGRAKGRAARPASEPGEAPPSLVNGIAPDGDSAALAEGEIRSATSGASAGRRARREANPRASVAERNLLQAASLDEGDQPPKATAAGNKPLDAAPDRLSALAGRLSKESGVAASNLPPTANEPAAPANATPQDTSSAAGTSRSIGGEAKSQSVPTQPLTGGPEGITPGDRVRLIQRVAKAFGAIGPSGGTMRIRLSPAELGQVKVEVSLKAGVLTARLEAEKTETRALLVDSLGDLRQRLAANNVRIASVEVDVQTQWHSDGSRQFERQDQNSNGQAASFRQVKVDRASSPEAPPAAGGTRRTVPGQLNVVV